MRRTRGCEKAEQEAMRNRCTLDFGPGKWPSPEDLNGGSGLSQPMVLRGFARECCPKTVNTLADVELLEKIFTNAATTGNQPTFHVRLLDREKAQFKVSKDVERPPEESPVPIMTAEQKTVKMSLPEFFQHDGFTDTSGRYHLYLTAYPSDDDMKAGAATKHDPFTLPAFNDVLPHAFGGRATSSSPHVDVLPNSFHGGASSSSASTSSSPSSTCSFDDLAQYLASCGMRCDNKALWISGAPTVSTATHFDDQTTVTIFAGPGQKTWYFAPPRVSAESLAGDLRYFKNPGEGDHTATAFLPWTIHPPMEGAASVSREESIRSWFHKVTVRDGDVLIVPAGWWHAVITRGHVVAVNTWWSHCRKDLDESENYHREFNAPREGPWYCWRCNFENNESRLLELSPDQQPSCLLCGHIKNSIRKDNENKCYQETSWRCKFCPNHNKPRPRSIFDDSGEGQNWGTQECTLCGNKRMEDSEQHTRAEEKYAALALRSERDQAFAELLAMGYDSDAANGALDTTAQKGSESWASRAVNSLLELEPDAQAQAQRNAEQEVQLATEFEVQEQAQQNVEFPRSEQESHDGTEASSSGSMSMDCDMSVVVTETGEPEKRSRKRRRSESSEDEGEKCNDENFIDLTGDQDEDEDEQYEQAGCPTGNQEESSHKGRDRDREVGLGSCMTPPLPLPSLGGSAGPSAHLVDDL